MCGRFVLEHEWAAFVDLYDLPWNEERGRNTQVRWNIAPTQDVLIVHNDADGKQTAETARWWLVPLWAKELPKATLFNARIETIDTTPAFRNAFKTKRCLVPADGFYEWTVNANNGKKDPWFIYQPGGAPFSFAGVWAMRSWMSRAARSSRCRRANRCPNFTTDSLSSSIRPSTRTGSIRRPRLRRQGAVDGKPRWPVGIPSCIARRELIAV